MNRNNDTHRSTTVAETVREVRVTLVLHRPELDTLRAIADGRSLSFMVRRAIAHYVAKQTQNRGKHTTVDRKPH
jgi:hypothetical protein